MVRIAFESIYNDEVKSLKDEERVNEKGDAMRPLGWSRSRRKLKREAAG